MWVKYNKIYEDGESGRLDGKFTLSATTQRVCLKDYLGAKDKIISFGDRLWCFKSHLNSIF